ncbi:hypothetical protein TraAM80_08011 [Trypanosoma rangeli]|uniref:Uncharacterized protein n=1 Tax=Trypanosoma rangeli TaxID=5698 RepID=A0A3R7K0J8_TRYRA|nr:uncharacterized protein TraAM80_08011 [Trypanosoma rangeli]RNE99747.1 hypothetical protein TraAM80_08011 [Trypanosoma rangeli]|eukprot:RNE99747.1 hypothetical protein TraAM80_08011 [Trypanosoma rangeli]
MPEITTPFLLTMRGGEQMHLREKPREPQSLAFITALTTLVFTRRLGKAPLTPVTVSLVALCDTVGTDASRDKRFTIASHQFAASEPASAESEKTEDTAVVLLRSPIVLSSSGPVRALEVRCTETRCQNLTRSQLADAAVYGVTMHGMQQTTLTKAQVRLLCGAGNETRLK